MLPFYFKLDPPGRGDLLKTISWHLKWKYSFSLDRSTKKLLFVPPLYGHGLPPDGGDLQHPYPPQWVASQGGASPFLPSLSPPQGKKPIAFFPGRSNLPKEMGV